MRILENCADGGRELFVAFGAQMQTGADFLRRVRRDFPNPLGIGVFAVRANWARSASELIRGMPAPCHRC